tara:strand:- start:228 stop:815 length:588 start_codon:yes stop_codon:yes gene_type:complete
MISDKHKIIFIHIPRTSGTSIESAFKFNMDKVGGKHLKASEIKRNIGNDKWNNYFKFSIVRNPWERFVSMYSMPFLRKINRLSGKSIDYFFDNYYLPQHESCLTCSEYLDLEDLNLIGKYEKRKAFLEELKTNLNSDELIKKNLDNNWERKTINNKLPWYELFNHRVFDLITSKYIKDIERFNYDPYSFRELISI